MISLGKSLKHLITTADSTPQIESEEFTSTGPNLAEINDNGST